MSNHKFKKALGQNFLRSRKHAEALVASIDPQPGDLIIEIGPGDGSITKILLAQPDVKIISIEVDYMLIPNLVKRFGGFDNFDLLHQSILETDIATLINGESSYKVIGSLPYNISREIINKFINSEHKPLVMGFIVQEEMADKYSALAPHGTLLGNQIQLRGKVTKLKSIAAQYFFPQPKVKGAILQIVPTADTVEPELDKLIQIGFSSPRKTLFNNVQATRKWDSYILQEAWQRLGWDTKARAAEITLSDWRNLLKLLQ